MTSATGYWAGIRDGAIFEVRNEDGQVISTHATNEDAQAAAQRHRLDRDMQPNFYGVFGPVFELFRQ